MDNGRIRQLPEDVSDQIAAGEVVERPASVVKELTENAIDAGAREIEVAMWQGGKKAIEVRDDGAGIHREDLPLAVKRHATSKIASASDLNTIGTLGFRGEALASIASVAEIKVVSRVEENTEAYELSKSPSGDPEVKPAGRKPGTTVRVSDLFQNVPARRKFLKTDRTERKHVIREVQKKILSHPEIRFRLIEESDSVIYSVPPGPLDRRIGETIGEEVAEHTLPIERHEPDWRGLGEFALSGRISDGEVLRRTRRYQHLFVNERSVRDPVLYRAITRAYGDLLRSDDHPAVVLFLEMPPDEVDVNVHPRKEKVRYNNSDAVFRFVYDHLRETLEGHFQDRAKTHLDSGKSVSIDGSDKREGSPPARVPGSGGEGEEEAATSTTQPEIFSHGDDGGTTSRVLGQFRDTFLVVERGSGLLLVDQHTAHEKILYEQYLEETASEEPAQFLSIPMNMEVDPADREALLSHAPQLESLGLTLESFGEGSLVVQSIPGYLGRRSDDKRLIFGMIEEWLEWEHRDRLSEPGEDMLAIMSCRSAVMRGDKLMPREQEELIRGLNELDFPGKCPHGRRIFYEITNREITDWFERPAEDLCSPD